MAVNTNSVRESLEIQRLGDSGKEISMVLLQMTC